MNRPKRRSLLFFPGSEEKHYQSAWHSNADTIIIDWEDSVPDYKKVVARGISEKQVNLLLNQGPKEIAIRINSPRSCFFSDDVLSISSIGPVTIIIPKVDSLDDINTVERAFSSYTDPGSYDYIGIIETVKGYHNRASICSRESRISAVMLGLEDLAADLSIKRPDNIQLSDTFRVCAVEVQMAAAAGGKQAIGPVSRYYGPRALMSSDEARYLKSIGYIGRGVIHPSQIDTVNGANAIFNIGHDEIQDAIELIERFERQNTAVVAFDFTMLDLPSYRKAHTFLRYARTHGFLKD
jgi:citrate lyase subunit beta / citryl-CoA lyase